MVLDSMKEIFDAMEAQDMPFWEVVLQADMEDRQVTRQQSMAKMLRTWQAMEEAANNYSGARRSVSGLVGGDGLKMRQYNLKGKNLAGGYVGEVIAEALSMAESNACMCRIVAAPTAGACGVLPAVLYYMHRDRGFPKDEILDSLAVAGMIGNVIRTNASISGAECGCQAEIGTACSMAAAS
mgnify:CR=1 FL=1